MKRFLLSLVGVALVSAAATAQTPVLPTSGPGRVLLDPPVPITGALGGGHGHGCCAQDRVTCVPEQYIKKTKNVTFSSGCEPLCLCYFHGFHHFRCGCENGHCEHPHTVRYLVKKVQTCETCATKCVPSTACGAVTGVHATMPAMNTLPGVPDRAETVFPKALPK